jgi:predicted CXXCH cytochrome family protein
VRENCLNCHQPHGSNYENLLKVARPRLCHECHSFAHGTGGFGTPTTAYVLGKACGNCHSNIHGSNHPSGMFFLR